MGYPERAVRWLAGDAPARVLQLDAAHGEVTAVLAALGHELVIADPASDAEVPAGAHAVRTGGDGLPFASRTFDVVVVTDDLAGRLDHRGLGRRLPDVARVLRPGGTLAVARDRLDHTIPWVRRLLGAAPDEGPGTRPWLASDHVGDPRSATFGHWQETGADGLERLLAARGVPSPRARVEEVLREHAGVAGTLRLRYRTECDRTTVLHAEHPHEADDGLQVSLGRTNRDTNPGERRARHPRLP